jgi:hypothetical protein
MREVPATTCPRCETEHAARFLRCACGYDAVATAQWALMLVTQRRNRKLALGSIPIGVALFVATFGTPMMSMGIFAVAIGPVIAWMANSYVREAKKQLREVKAPRPLPQARLV